MTKGKKAKPTPRTVGKGTAAEEESASATECITVGDGFILSTDDDLLERYLLAPLEIVQKVGPKAAVLWGLIYLRGLNTEGCWMSLRSMSAYLRGVEGKGEEFGPQVVRRFLNVLVEGGWLERQDRSGRSTLYRVVTQRHRQFAFIPIPQPVPDSRPLSPKVWGGITDDMGPLSPMIPNKDSLTRTPDKEQERTVVGPPPSPLEEVKAKVKSIPGVVMTKALEAAIESHPETATANAQRALEVPGGASAALLAASIQGNYRPPFRVPNLSGKAARHAAEGTRGPKVETIRDALLRQTCPRCGRLFGHAADCPTPRWQPTSRPEDEP
jgi:hypothetical protein